MSVSEEEYLQIVENERDTYHAALVWIEDIIGGYTGTLAERIGEVVTLTLKADYGR